RTISVLSLPSFLFYCSGNHRVLHSFPTRRSSDLLLSIGGGLVSNLVYDWLAIKELPVEETELHVEFKVVKEDSTHEFKADGKASNVLRTLKEFEEKWK